MRDHHHVHCCDDTGNVDNLFQEYHNDRETVVKQVMNDPSLLVKLLWKKGSPLAVDDECQCKLGKGQKFTGFACSQCTAIEKVTDLPADEFMIECGKNAGMVLVVHTYKTDKKVSFDEEAKKRAEELILFNSELLYCGSPKVKELRCLRADEFTNHLLIGWMVQHIFENAGLPHFHKIYTGFICSKQGYSIEDRIYPIDNYHSTLFNQCLAMFHCLQSIGFSMMRPMLSSMKCKKTPCSYRYQKKTIGGPITLVIPDFSQCSMLIDGTHFSSHHVEDEFRSVNFSIQSIQPLSNFSVYKITDDNINVFKHFRHVGVPLFVGSFDLYCMMVSILHKYFNQCQQEKMWHHSWLYDQDRKKVETRILSHKRDLEFNDILEILKDVTLMCSLANHLMEK